MFVRVQAGDGNVAAINLRHVDMIEVRESYNHSTGGKVWSVKARIRDTYYTLFRNKDKELCKQYLDWIMKDVGLEEFCYGSAGGLLDG